MMLTNIKYTMGEHIHKQKYTGIIDYGGAMKSDKELKRNEQINKSKEKSCTDKCLS